MMNKEVNLLKIIISFTIFLTLLVGIPLAVFLVQQRQNIRQQAAAEPDLVVESLQLTDAGGNVKTVFNKNEDIYVQITLKNQGGAKAESTDGFTYTAIYSDKATTASFGSDEGVDIIMKNGEFAAGAKFTYSSIYGSSSQSRFTKAFSFRKTTPGKYIARAFINYNKFATEGQALYDNNQLTLEYTISDTPTYNIGKASTTKPTDFQDSYCYQNAKLVAGLDGCVMDKPVNGKTYGKITNNGSTTRTVGMASYKAYYPYPDPYPSCTPEECPKEYNWIWTQTIFSAVSYELPPGKTVYFEVTLPDCAWQTDVFEGSILPSFTPGNYYSGIKKYIDGYYHIIPVCQPVIPSPTPTPTLTPLPTPTPTPTSTPTPTPPIGGPPPTDTPTPTPTPTATPTPSSCPVPQQVLNVRIRCPNCSNEEL
jgi:hypothetical protein